MLYLGSDHRGFELKEKIKEYLDDKNIKYEDCGTDSNEIVHYPQIAAKVCRKMDTKTDKAILICGSGIGMSISANKFKGIRAGICGSLEAVEDGKAHDDINILILPAGFISEKLAIEIYEKWVELDFLEGRYRLRLKMIDEIEKDNMK